MAFVTMNDIVVSFAESQDVLDVDQRIFEANEGLTDDIVEKALTRSTQRILTRIRNTDWWRRLNQTHNQVVRAVEIADVDPMKILARHDDFTALCVFTALSEQILPGVADFSNEDSAERQKMAYYGQRAEKLFLELITAGDWYDFDADGEIQSTEKQQGIITLKRVR